MSIDNNSSLIEVETPENNSNEGFDFIPMLKKVWNGKITIIIAVAISFVFGVVFAIITPKEYSVTTVMVPQMNNENKSSQLSNLASLAGLNLGMVQTSDLSPLVYPNILNSIPFKLQLMNSPLNFSKVDHPVSYLEYYSKYYKPTLFDQLKKYTIKLPLVILSKIKKKTKPLKYSGDSLNLPIHLTKEEYIIKKMLDKQLSLNVERKDGYIVLSVTGPEALVTAQLAKTAQSILQREITNFKIEKTKADLEFIEGRYNVAKAQFENVQVELASSIDRNRDLTSGLSSVQRDRTQTKYTIAYSVYQDLAKQLEQAKIQVKKDTPVFTIIQPVYIPLESSSPNRVLIILIWLFMGLGVGASIIFLKDSIPALFKKWNETEI